MESPSTAGRFGSSDNLELVSRTEFNSRRFGFFPCEVVRITVGHDVKILEGNSFGSI